MVTGTNLRGESDRMLFFETRGVVPPRGFGEGLCQYFGLSPESGKHFSKHGYIRVITRPKGLRVEVEISIDSGHRFESRSNTVSGG